MYVIAEHDFFSYATNIVENCGSISFFLILYEKCDQIELEKVSRILFRKLYILNNAEQHKEFTLTKHKPIPFVYLKLNALFSL